MALAGTAGDFGIRLREAREARGVSLREIANATKISIGVLEALERNDFSKLPGGIFSRAFIRAYAHEVGLDPEETVRAFLASLPADSAAARLHAPPRLVDQDEAVFESRQRMALVALRLVLVSLPLALLLLYFTVGRNGRSGWPPASSPTSMPTTVGRSGGAGGAAGEGAGMRGAAGASWLSAAGAAQAEPPQPASSPAEAGLALEIAPVATCWISLTVDGRLVVARNLEAGERIVQRVREEASLHIGDAGAFAFTINGRPGRPIGARGEVKTLRITRDTYESLVR